MLRDPYFTSYAVNCLLSCRLALLDFAEQEVVVPRALLVRRPDVGPEGADTMPLLRRREGSGLPDNLGTVRDELPEKG